MALLARVVGDWRDPNAFANRMRSRRLALFESLLDGIPRPLKILDIGGTPDFWQMRGWHERPAVHITVLNLFPQPSPCPSIATAEGDATDLRGYADRSFDVAFSNSV